MTCARYIRGCFACAMALFLAASAAAAQFDVRPGESIQAAIDGAAEGDVIRVAPGTYNESLTIRTPGLTLVGMDESGQRAVLDGQGAELEIVRIETRGVRLEGFVVRNAVATGVVVFMSNEVALEHLIVEDNNFIGINVADSSKVTIEGVVSSGHGSAGVLIAQSRQVTVAASDCYNNLTGIRLENSGNFVLENNSLFANTGGIAVFTLPGRSKPRSEYGRITYNRIFGNNRKNTADPGTIDAAVIPGVGLYVVAADHIEAAFNRFERNGTYAAIAVGLPNSTLPVKDAAEADPNTDHLYIHHNRYADNGNEPSKAFEDAFSGRPAGDLYWDETGERNQWQESGEFRTVPEKLVQQQGGAHTNVIHFI